MNLPQIDLTAIPALDIMTGLYGSVVQAGSTYNDGVVAIMVYVYENVSSSLPGIS